MKVNLLDFDLQGLIAHSASMGERAFRAEQLMRWIHQAGESDFGRMTDLAKSFRAKLVETAEVAPLPILSDTTAVDGTRKWLIRLGPGIEAEAVFIPGVGKAGALCVSSQVGCTLNCTFCHTGTQKLVRNLSSAEIVTQVMIARDALGDVGIDHELIGVFPMIREARDAGDRTDT